MDEIPKCLTRQTRHTQIAQLLRSEVHMMEPVKRSTAIKRNLV